ncbi:MAG: hypothetical protein EHM15_01500, partial [Desulfobacteraceae bacterium]
MRKTCLWGIIFLAVLLALPAPDGWCAKPGKVKAAPVKEPTPTELTAEKVDPYLATLTDEQTRKELARMLKQSAAEKAAKTETGGSWLA